MKIAAQLYTLRDFMQNEEQIRDTLIRVKEIGYSAVQVSGIGEFTRDKVMLIKEVCEDLDLTICATHTGLKNLEEELDWVIEYHKLWNCHFCGVGMMPMEYAASEESLITFANIMNVFGKQLKEAGITLVYHNHAFEFARSNGKLGFQILFDHFSDDVQFEIDTYWIHMGGCDVVHWVKKVKDRMEVIHFKDIAVKGWDKPHMEVVGDGNFKWNEIIDASKETGVKWACVEQDDCQGRDPFECLDKSLQFLHGKGLN